MASDNEFIIYTKISTDGLVAGTKELEAACKRAASTVSGIGKTAQQSVQKSVAAISKQNQAYNAQLEKVRQIQAMLAASTGQRVETAQYANLRVQLQKVADKLAQVDERKRRFIATGGDEGSTAFARMEYDGERLVELYDTLIEKQKQLEATGGDTQPVDTSALQSKLAGEENKLAGMQTNLEQSVGDLGQKLAEYGQDTEEAKSKTGALKDVFSSVGSAAKSVGSAVLSGIGKALSTVGSIAKSAGKALLNVAKKGLHAVAAGAKKAASGFAGLVKKMAGFGGDSGKSSLGRSLTTMLKYGLGIRSLYALTNKLRTALTDGMSNLKSYSNSANQSITAMENSVSRLKNSVAAAFSPILSVVAPIVTKLINLLATAISYIGAFFAALSGKSTYTKAVASTEGVAGALDDAAGAAGGAADAMDDYLSGLDEVKRFDDGSSGGGGGGGGGGSSGGSSGVMFEEDEIPGLVTDWADKFKEAWEQADFTEIGTVVGTKLKDALDGIPWAGIQEKCNKIASSVATFINGFVATPGLWDTVGSTIGEGINTAVGMYNKFMDTTNFVSIGNAISTTLNKTLKTTDWTATGKALTQKLRAAIETMYGFVTTFDFGELGDSISKFINGAINNVPTDKFGTAIGKLVNGIATVIVRVFGGVDKQNLVTKIKDFFKNAFNAVDPNLIKSAITTVINSLIDLIGTVFGTSENTGVLNKLVDFLKDVFKGVNVNKLLVAIDSLTNTLTDVIYEAVSSIDLLYILTVLFDAFNAILAGLLSQIPVIGESIAEHLRFDYSADYLKEKGVTLGESTATGVNDGFGSLGTELPITAANAVDKTKAEIDNRDGSFTAAGTAAASGVVNGLDTAIEGAGAAGTSTKAAFTDPWATTGEEFQVTSTEIVGALDNLPPDVGVTSEEAYTGMVSEFDTAESDFEAIADNVSGAFDGVPKTLKKTFSKAYSNAKGEWKTAKSDFSRTSADIISSFSNLASGLKIKFASAFTAAKEAWNSAKSSFSTTSADIISAFSNLASGVKIKFNSAFTAAKEAWSGAKSAFTSIANNVVSGFSGVASGVKSHFSTACSGITSLGWYSAGAAAAKAVVNGMYSYSPSSWCSWFVGKISFSGTYNIGYNLTAGIIRGMYSTSGLGSWASWFIAKVKASLGIHSPSTIMRDEVGVYLGEGIGEGLEKSTGGILKSVSGLADKIVDGFQDGVSGITLDSPLLAGGALSGLNYKYPVLASGTVIPPQVVYSTQKVDTSDIIDHLKALVANLGGSTSGDKTAAGNVIHNVVQINRRTLYEEMVKEEDLVNSQSGRV